MEKGNYRFILRLGGEGVMSDHLCSMGNETCEYPKKGHHRSANIAYIESSYWDLTS